MRKLELAAAVALILSPLGVSGSAVAQYAGPFYPGGPGMYGGYMPGAGYYPGERRRARARGAASYRGFRIKLAYPAGSPEGARELAGVQNQIEIVRRAGLSGADLQRFRHQAIGFGARSHMGHGHAVSLANLGPDDSRPVLLHEYMHVYHHTRLPGGNANPTVRRFYQEALANGLYPQGSYMMKNPGEFFAMTASCYLNGTVARPPYTREAIRAAQPGYYAYLAHLFGPRG